MAAQDGDGGILPYLRIARYQPVDGFDEIAHALALVGYALRYEEDDMLVGWQTGTQTRLCLILRTEHVGIYRIRDVGDALAYEETAALCLPFEPTATGDASIACRSQTAQEFAADYRIPGFPCPESVHG